MDFIGLDEADHEATPALARLKVLVVDDQEVNRLAVSLILRPTGARVTCAATSAEALEQLAHRPFDAIVMDGAMPGLPGRGARRMLGDLAGPNPNVPVIPITAWPEPEGTEVSQAAGMRVEVGRFIDPAALYAALGALLDTSVQAAAVA